MTAKDTDNIWVALLRGINVGGNNILPMVDLRALLAGLGYANPRTYIQSGNCVFAASGNAEDISAAITQAIEKAFGFAPHVLLLTLDQMRAAIDGNPFADVDTPLKTVHLFFMTDADADINTDRMDALKADSETYSTKDGVLYLHAPDGVGRSKLVAKIDSCISAPVTARNLNSANKILALAETP